MLLRLLIIGISFLFFSCERTEDDGATITHFTFQNSTTQIVELILVNKITNENSIFILNPNKSKVFSKRCLGGGKGFCGCLYGENDISFKFVEINKCLINFPKVHDIISYDNFSTEMYNFNENNLIYKIDNEEIFAATACN